MRAVFTPMQEAMARFCVTPRTNKPKRVWLINKATAAKTIMANSTIKTRFHGRRKLAKT